MWGETRGFSCRCRHRCVCVCVYVLFSMFVSMFVCKSGSWPSLAVFSRMCLNIEGCCYWRVCLCTLHLRVHTDLHRRSLHRVCWQDIQSHHTETLFLSSNRASGLSHQRSVSKPRGRIGGGQRSVWTEEMISVWIHGWRKHQSFGEKHNTMGGSKLVILTLSAHFSY